MSSLHKMYGLFSLAIVALGCLLPSTGAQQCWRGNIVLSCLLLHQQSTDCEEFRLGQNYHVLITEQNLYDSDHWVSICVPCETEPSNMGLTCRFNSTYKQENQIFSVHRVMVFVYLTTTSKAGASISFDHVENESMTTATRVHIDGKPDGRPIGPFYVDVDEPPLHLRHLRCMEDSGETCDVQLTSRRPFAFVHYISENSEP